MGKRGKGGGDKGRVMGEGVKGRERGEGLREGKGERVSGGKNGEALVLG